MSMQSVMPSSHLTLCRPLLLLPPIPPSIRVFSHESTLRMRWPKYWSFSFSIIPSKEIPGLISFRMDRLDLNFQMDSRDYLAQTSHLLDKVPDEFWELEELIASLEPRLVQSRMIQNLLMVSVYSIPTVTS